MAIDRRHVLAGGAAWIVAAGGRGASPARAAFESNGPLLAAARETAAGQHEAVIMAGDGRTLATVALPERGHDAAFCRATRRCAFFARRPESFAVIVPLDGTRPVHRDERHGLTARHRSVGSCCGGRDARSARRVGQPPARVPAVTCAAAQGDRSGAAAALHCVACNRPCSAATNVA
jgi:hypothetical protein